MMTTDTETTNHLNLTCPTLPHLNCPYLTLPYFLELNRSLQFIQYNFTLFVVVFYFLVPPNFASCRQQSYSSIPGI